MTVEASQALDDDPRLAAGLVGHTVVCTGATGAIGYAVARLLARGGARVLAVDLEANSLAELTESLPGSGHSWIATDLSDAETADRLAHVAESSAGDVHALVHMAGVLRRQPIEEVTPADWDWQIETNLRAAFFVARGFCRLFVASGRPGSVTAFTSQAWWTGGQQDAAAYSASKGGVVSVCRALARGFGAHAVRVNVVAPGAIDSPMLRGGLRESALDAAIAATPLGRLGTPEDVAAATVFLASDNARFLTGTVLNVSGGWLMY